ncbi:S1C family serine protease [Jeotgalibacillus sp. R-1-5s-1]|uniref:S1C family serine protease n=1 Tax=Jeotgalibacillus sp. R-1-5s-1 TaxID=2555897 RepID=UPI00106AB38C|nr:trypsin-like peptidase domain-containing protein [Jeotgalibacillus sp. R-1-5s-1]TFD96599.1 PDZ domain-containing protein [Jeotgalibacillus sp. R-1-5s-1]
MGYYDDQETRERMSRKKSGSKAGYFLSSLSGLIVGALLVTLLMPMMGNGGSPAVNNTSSGDGTQSAQTQNVSYDVSSDVTSAVEKAGGAVVGVTNLQSGQSLFGGQSGEATEAGTGSGVIYKSEGDVAYIVTNYHVIEGSDQVEVTLADGTKEEAQVLGGDQWTDLAVLQISNENVDTVAEFGDSQALKPGEPVIAIGNPLGLQFSGSVTTGVVSGVERTIPVDINQDGAVDWQAEVIQTDAAINPGNSGGALVNIQGQLVGINSMKIAQSSVEGIGLAIPIDMAAPIIEDLETQGEVLRPTMGITLYDLANVSVAQRQSELNLPEEVESGVVIQRVVPDSAAAAAGLEDFDVIVEMDGKKINNSVELRQHLYTEKEVGDELQVKVYRNGEMQEFTLTLTDDADL